MQKKMFLSTYLPYFFFGPLQETNYLFFRPNLFSGRLTYSCLEISLTSVVSSDDTFENNFGIKHEFTKDLKGSCHWVPIGIFPSNFLRKILWPQRYKQNTQGTFGKYRHKWFNPFTLRAAKRGLTILGIFPLQKHLFENI